jgi:hypothetical protein
MMNIKELEYLRKLTNLYEENERYEKSKNIIKNLRSSIENTINYIYEGHNMIIEINGDIHYDSWIDIIKELQIRNINSPIISDIYLLYDTFYCNFNKKNCEVFYYRTNYDNNKRNNKEYNSQLFLEQFEIINLVKINILLGLNLYDKLYFNPKKNYSHHISKFEIINSEVYCKIIKKYILKNIFDELPDVINDLIFLYIKPIKQKTYFINERCIIRRGEPWVRNGLSIAVPEVLGNPWNDVWDNNKKEKTYNLNLNYIRNMEKIEIKGDKFMISDTNQYDIINNNNENYLKIYYELINKFKFNYKNKYNDWCIWFNKKKEMNIQFLNTIKKIEKKKIT